MKGRALPSRRTYSAGLAALLLTIAAGAAPAGPPENPGRLVLDETAYWRHYYQFGWDQVSPAQLREGGVEAMVTARSYRTLRRDTETRLKHLGLDLSKVGWRDHAVLRLRHVQGADSDPRALEHYIHTPPPPAGWAAPDFDDTNWCRGRRPLLVGAEEKGADWAYSRQGVPVACFRTCFVVDDPAAAGTLALRLVYHGGARVFFNGRELARGDLPAGGLGYDFTAGAAEARATDYPIEAYVRLPEELTDQERRRYAKYDGGPLRGGHAGPAYVPELPGSWEQAPVVQTARDGRPELRRVRRRWGIDRRTWRRLSRLRDRVLEVVLPPEAVRRGTNVLGVELRSACMHPITQAQAGASCAGWGPGDWGDARTWDLIQLRRLELRATGRVTCATTRPAGVQVWVEDVHHRVHETEFLPPGEAGGRVRIVGGPGGCYAAQVVVGTDKPLTGVGVCAGELSGPGGATIAPGAWRVGAMMGHPLSTLSALGQGRGTPGYTKDPLCEPALLGLKRYGPPGAAAGGRDERLAALEELRYFDGIANSPAASIPADRCQAYWLSLTIPRDARPGRYAGELTVSLAGRPTARLPVEVEVVAWRVPPARHFQTIAALEQSPYAVARHFDVPLWSERHFERMTGSYRQLARIGNDWLFVPVMNASEFGNRTDSPVRWVRTADGELRLDLRILDRYLDLAEEHWGRPRLVTFVVMDGSSEHVPAVTVTDAATGRTEALKLIGPGIPPKRTRRLLTLLATRLYAHMKARGLGRAMRWGYTWDGEGFPEMKALLAAGAPEVAWSAGPHSFRLAPDDAVYYDAVSRIYGRMLGVRSRRGWKVARTRPRAGRTRPLTAALLAPRHGGSVHCTNGNSPPFSYRLMTDRALVAGNNGIGRIGADYWDGTYYDGAGGTVWCQAGIGTLATLRPGPRGARPSARFEMLLEGMQEAEIRIFVEQALDRGLVSGPPAERAQRVLFEHNRETFFIPVVHPAVLLNEYSFGWRERSARLYRLAAEVARAVGLDTDRTDLVIDAAAGAKAAARLTVRNWLAEPRPWKARAEAPWLSVAPAEGVADGFVALAVTADAAALPPDRTARGTVTVTDVASGRDHRVHVAAAVGPLLEFPERVSVNLAPGQTARRRVTLVNLSARPLTWRLDPAEPWLSARPAAGRVEAFGSAGIDVIAAPPDRAAVTRTGRLRLSVKSGGGGARSRPSPAVLTVTAHVIPAYAEPPRPVGTPVWLCDAVAKGLAPAEHVVAGHAAGDRDAPWWARRPKFTGHPYEAGKTVDVPFEMGSRRCVRGWWVRPPHRTRFDVAGAGLKAFAAVVGLSDRVGRDGRFNAAAVVAFEIYVDGKLAAHSGLLRAGDKPRLLVLTGLAGARNVTFVTRRDTDERDDRALAVWADARFYK